MYNEKDNEKQAGLELVVLRNEFYRDSYYRVLTAVFFVLLINALLGFLIYYKWTHPPQPQYFATTPDGKIIKVHALTDPTVSDDFVLQWTSDSVRKAFNLDYVHWREQLQDASANFTPDGWKYFQAALTDSNDLKTLVDLKMVSDAQITGAPSITRKAIISGHYAWVVQLPVLIAFTSAGKNINQPINLTVVVVREPVDSYPQKIAINNIFSGTVSPSAYK